MIGYTQNQSEKATKMIESQYKQCSISVMDNIADHDITFDQRGICNYYYEYQQIASEQLFQGPEGRRKLELLFEEIRKNGKGKPYDCVTGISGGVDSSYLIYLAKQWGLRPLIVHFDNGWNTETAVANINNIIQHTGFDLYTIVVDWEEFKDLQLAYLKASVVDIEVPTDHAIGGTLQKLAAKFDLKYVLSGNNVVTEAILPPSWTYNKADYVNLTNIYKKFSNRSFKTYPLFGFKEQVICSKGKGITTVKPLNFIDYNKEEAKKTIGREMSWKDYGGKHYESFFTKFYQAYILPEKFRIDKRKPHLSTMIFSGQTTKEEALKELEKPLYDPREREADIEYFLKKIGLSAGEFDRIMKTPRVDHLVFGKQKPVTEQYAVTRILKEAYKLMAR